MELVDQRFLCDPFVGRVIGGGMDTTRFAVIFLPSSSGQAFFDVDAVTFLTTQPAHYPSRTEEPPAVRIILTPRAVATRRDKSLAIDQDSSDAGANHKGRR